MAIRPEDLPSDPAALAEMVLAFEGENEDLRAQIATLKGLIFGARSERSAIICAEQLALDLERTVDVQPPANDDEPKAIAPRTKRRKPRRNIGALPAHLPRCEQVIEPASTLCPCCSGQMHRIGEETSEALDRVPAWLRVLRTIRPKYACRGCEGSIVQASAPARLVEGGMATTALKKRRGGEGGERGGEEGVGKGEKKKRRGEKGGGGCQFWAHATDDRPWKGPAPPAVGYVFAGGRGKKEIVAQLAGFEGVLQVDGYAAYASLAGDAKMSGKIRLAYCLVHARRNFVKVHKTTNSPFAREVIERIGAVYAIEEGIRGLDADERRAVRQAETRPLMEALKARLEAVKDGISRQSTLIKAIDYMLERWEGLTAFLNDGRLEPDTNTVERSIRPIAIGKKNGTIRNFVCERGGHLLRRPSPLRSARRT